MKRKERLLLAGLMCGLLFLWGCGEPVVEEIKAIGVAGAKMVKERAKNFWRRKHCRGFLTKEKTVRN